MVKLISTACYQRATQFIKIIKIYSQVMIFPFENQEFMQHTREVDPGIH